MDIGFTLTLPDLTVIVYAPPASAECQESGLVRQQLLLRSFPFLPICAGQQHGALSTHHAREAHFMRSNVLSTFLNATVPHICPSRTPRCDGFRSIDGMVTYPTRVNGRFLHSPAPVTALSYKPSLFLCTCNHISWLFPIHLCASDQDVVHGNMNYTHNTLALPHSLEGEIQTYSASRCILSHP